MSKPLQEMSRNELGQLFPIILREYDKNWRKAYTNEKDLLEKSIGKTHIVRINHYGSTSVEGLIAKPTVDILLEVEEDIKIPWLIEKIEKEGYIYTHQPDNPPPHMMFMKGYTKSGFQGQAFHLHVRYPGDWDELYFRDYLKIYPEVARNYGELKLKLKNQYEHDRDGYTLAKTDFIKEITAHARKEFKGRYEFAD